MHFLLLFSRKRVMYVVYNVDVARIGRQFDCLKICITVMHELQDKAMDSLINRFALARAIHISIESIIDVGSVLIDGFIMRDPGGYADIIEILEDESVISAGLSKEIRCLIQIRTKLVHDYTELEVEGIVPYRYKTHLLELFMDSVSKYLEKELV